MRRRDFLKSTGASAFSAGFLRAAQRPPVKSPERGFVTYKPASNWDSGLISGNGTLGAVVYGQPLDETIVLNHAQLWMPWEKPLPPVETASHLAEIRKMLAEGKYQQAAAFVVELSNKEGYTNKRWTDPLIPAFDLRISMEASGDVRGYARYTDFETGVATVQWDDDRGTFRRRLFVSRPDNVIALSITGPGRRQVNCRIRAAQRPVTGKPFGYPYSPEKMFADGIKDVEVGAEGNWLTYRSSFRRTWPGSLQGYEGVARVVQKGGTASVEGKEIVITGADEVVVLVRIDLSKDYSQPLIPKLRQGLASVSTDFEALLKRHAKVHGEMFSRVRLDLGGGGDRDLPAEELFAKSKIGNLLPALLEKEFDSGRYAIISSTGEWPPSLQGIWNGKWAPPWSGDYTNNGNVQSAIASMLSGNMAELMLAFFRYMEFMLPDMRENARRFYGCRGILLPSRTSSHGLNNHFDRTWPMTFWTAGAAWAAHFYYDYWLFTGDRGFLAKRAIPFMKEAAAFYEDFLIEDANGKWLFSPSYSPENNPGNSKSQSTVNATMDIALGKELFRNLIAACQELGIEKDGIERWTKMLAKMPDYMLSPEGAVKEWTHPELADNYSHRHCSHLVGLFDGLPPDVEDNPALKKAFARAVELRMAERRKQNAGVMAFGIVQLGQTATSLGDGETAYECVDWLANKFWGPHMVSWHDPGIFNIDGSGGMPAVLIKMLLYSQPGRIDLLPALPSKWRSGRVQGLPCRGQVLLKSLGWDGKTVTATLRSARAQHISITVPRDIERFDVKTGKASIAAAQAAQQRARSVSLPAQQDVTVEIRMV